MVVSFRFSIHLVATSLPLPLYNLFCTLSPSLLISLPLSTSLYLSLPLPLPPLHYCWEKIKRFSLATLLFRCLSLFRRVYRCLSLWSFDSRLGVRPELNRKIIVVVSEVG